MPAMFVLKAQPQYVHMEQVVATLPGSVPKMPQIQRETFIYSNNQITICLAATCMPLSMLNYQSQVTTVSYSLMKTCIKDECKTYKMWSK